MREQLAAYCLVYYDWLAVRRSHHLQLLRRWVAAPSWHSSPRFQRKRERPPGKGRCCEPLCIVATLLAHLRFLLAIFDVAWIKISGMVGQSWVVTAISGFGWPVSGFHRVQACMRCCNGQVVWRIAIPRRVVWLSLSMRSIVRRAESKINSSTVGIPRFRAMVSLRT